jgi:hypothetical protein
MCDLATASLAFAAVGAMTSAGGAMMQGQAQSQAAAYQAAVAMNNEKVAKQNATMALEQGEAQEQAQRQKTAQMVGTERAVMGANDIEMNSGSALNVQKSTVETGELDALTIRSNAQLNSRNFLQQASNFGSQAGLLSAQSSWAMDAGIMGAGSSLLGGASTITNNMFRNQQLGLLTGGGGN